MGKLDQWLKKNLNLSDSKKEKPQATRTKTFLKNKENKKPNNGTKIIQNNGPKFGKNNGPKKGPKDIKKNQFNNSPNKLPKGRLKIIPLGGLDEVGKNMMAFEYQDDIILIDMGFEFPSSDMLGIDYVIPDTTYLEERSHKIRGVILTHGHLDHIGGIPYILPKLKYPPMYGTKLTMGLVEKKIEEFKIKDFTKMHTINPDQTLKLGQFTVDFFRVAHSIPDAVGVIISTPAGKVVHTGDFKFDESPAGNQRKADIHKIKKLGSQNVLALFSDSTNALKPGHTMSEEQVGKTLEEVIKKVDKRIIIASFSSLIGRIQQIIEYAKKHGRTVYVSGRSMRDNVEIARKLGFIKYSNGEVQDIRKYKDHPDHKTLIITTGSQGESISALTRISNDEHKNIKIKEGDTVILSSSPIIGNERSIATVINRLCLKGAKVIHNKIMDVHTSGHGQQDELKRMINLVRPKYFIPIHGEYFMRQGHAILAEEQCKIPKQNIILIQNGDVLDVENGTVKVSKEKVETKYILIDGTGEGHIGSQVQADRQLMSENGALVVLINVTKKTGKIQGLPDVVSRGFIYMHESDEIIKEIKELTLSSYKRFKEKRPTANAHEVKQYIKQSIDKYTHQKIERRPLILPLIIEK